MRRMEADLSRPGLYKEEAARSQVAARGGSIWGELTRRNPDLGVVTAYAEGASGDLWIGTKRGLVLLAPSRRSWGHYEHDPEDANTLGGNEIISLMEDRSGLLWIGLSQGGVDKLDRSEARRSMLSHSFIPPV